MRENNLCGISGAQQAALLGVAPRFSKSTEVSLPGLRVSRSTVEVIVMAMASPHRNERTQRRPAPTGLVVRNDAETYEVEVAKALNQWAVTVTSVADGRMICQDFFSRRWEAVARAEDFIRLLEPLRAPSRLVAGPATARSFSRPTGPARGPARWGTAPPGPLTLRPARR